MEIKDTDTVIYLANDELARSYRWYKSWVGLSDSLKVVSLDDLPALQEQGFEFGSHQEMTILMQNPFRKKEYLDINSAESKIIREKISGINKIARKLGAKKISGYAEFIDETTIEYSLDGNLHYKAVEFNAEYKNEQNQKIKQLYNIENSFSGDWSEKTYYEAQGILKDYNLEQETEVRDLLDLRKPNEPNNLERQKVTMCVTSELNSCKEIAASLNVMKDIFKMSISTHNSVSRLKSISFISEIVF